VFDEIELPNDDALAVRTADRLRWSLDPADPFTNEVAAIIKDVIRGKEGSIRHLTERLFELT